MIYMKKLIFLLTIFIALVSVDIFAVKRKPIPSVKSTKLTDNLYKLFVHNYVNMFVFKGQEGVLLIDSGFEPVDLIQNELKKLGTEKIRYIINTHSNGDHINGNAVLDRMAVIISHSECRDDMEKREGFPTKALPSLVFENRMTLHFNGEEINLIHMPGHTGNDIAVYFKKAKIVFIGDLVFSDSFPGVQTDIGGNAFTLERTIANLVQSFPDDVVFAVGHGRDYSMSDLKKYQEMIKKTIAIVTPLIEKGISLEEIKGTDPLKDWQAWDSEFFPGEITTDTWINNIFDSYKIRFGN